MTVIWLDRILNNMQAIRVRGLLRVKGFSRFSEYVKLLQQQVTTRCLLSPLWDFLNIFNRRRQSDEQVVRLVMIFIIQIR